MILWLLKKLLGKDFIKVCQYPISLQEFSNECDSLKQNLKYLKYEVNKAMEVIHDNAKFHKEIRIINDELHVLVTQLRDCGIGEPVIEQDIIMEQDFIC